MTGLDRDGALVASDVMITEPRSHGVDATVADVRDAFDDGHLHMVLLVGAGVLHGALVREDLDPTAPADSPALRLATLHDRTAAPDEPVAVVRRRLAVSGRRRLAVVDDGVLLGLICLKSSGAGFCSDADVRSRSTG